MESITLKLEGLIPSKKNSKRIVCRGKHPLLLPSPAYEKWHKKELKTLKTRWGRGVGESKSTITIVLYDKLNKDGKEPKRTFDLTNKAESIMDLFVDAGIIKDDDYFYCPKVILMFGGFRADRGADVTVEYERVLQ